MEESVWTYFGVIIVLITIAIIVSIFLAYERDSGTETLFDSVHNLARQADVVCAAPRDTQLTARITVPANAVLYTETDRVCARIDDEVRCTPVNCQIMPGGLINLTGSDLFRSHEYACMILRNATLQINCEG